MNNTAIKENKVWGRESFRDTLSTINEKGGRNWLFPKKPKGKWLKRRSLFGYTLFAFLISAPFIKLNGHQLILFDILHRKFVIFGNVFWPQDFFIFLIGIITIIVSIFLFTSVFGRVWCGWACPQTIFMELLFRRVEYWIEGDAIAQRKLSAAPWTGEKIRKRGGKYAVFFGMSFFIANIFLSYFIGSDKLIKTITEPVADHWKGLAGVTLFSGIFFFVYAYLREQVCTVICPYGRLQSVLVDEKSLVVAYDYKRGEPRDKWGRKRSDASGDCIDCKQCVDVCPTGIDIRNGIQLECINCNLCIDACNSVMNKIGKPIDLISLNSLQGIEKKEKFKLDGRHVLYLAVIGVLVIALSVMLALRSDVQTTLLRQPGLTFVETPAGNVKNLYQIKVRNKTFENLPITFKVENVSANITIVGKKFVAPAETEAQGFISIEIAKNLLQSRNTELEIGVYANGKKLQTEETNFMGPDVNN